jgi:hypothetical protein
MAATDRRQHLRPGLARGVTTMAMGGRGRGQARDHRAAPVRAAGSRMRRTRPAQPAALAARPARRPGQSGAPSPGPPGRPSRSQEPGRAPYLAGRRHPDPDLARSVPDQACPPGMAVPASRARRSGARLPIALFRLSLILTRQAGERLPMPRTCPALNSAVSTASSCASSARIASASSSSARSGSARCGALCSSAGDPEDVASKDTTRSVRADLADVQARAPSIAHRPAPPPGADRSGQLRTAGRSRPPRPPGRAGRSQRGRAPH